MIIVYIIILFFLSYLAYFCFLFLIQRQILFPRRFARIHKRCINNDPGWEKIWLNTSYGKVEAWLHCPVPVQENKPLPAMILAHGNRELIDFWHVHCQKFRHPEMGILLVEYPGYGHSEGIPSQKTVTEAFVRGYDLLASRGDIDTSRIVFVGRSLGGGAVCALARERPAAALILISTFTDLRTFASQFCVPAYIVRDPFDNLSVVSTYPGPILVIHGKYDHRVPYEHGIKLYHAARHAEMLTYECGHNDFPPDWDQFWEDVEQFLYRAGILQKNNT